MQILAKARICNTAFEAYRQGDLFIVVTEILKNVKFYSLILSVISQCLPLL